MEVRFSMLYIVLFILILLITGVITLDNKINLATITFIIIIIMLLFSQLTIKYINGNSYDANPILPPQHSAAVYPTQYVEMNNQMDFLF